MSFLTTAARRHLLVAIPILVISILFFFFSSKPLKQVSQTAASYQRDPYKHHLQKRAINSNPLTSNASNINPFKKRAENDDDDEHFFNAYKCKGEKALGMIQNSPPLTRVFTRQDQIDAWEMVEEEDGFTQTTVTALQALGIPHGDHDYKNIVTYQTKQVRGPDGSIHPPTEAEYNNFFIPDPQKGTIIAKWNHSPLASRMAAKPVPALHRWSDVVWQNWTDIAGAQARNLRYIIRENILTPEVRRLIEYIEIQHEPDKLDLPWPGNVYDMKSEDGLALLGSPHGMGVTWLVVDHSNVLGRKIPAVRVFTVGSRERPGLRPFQWLYYLVFELRNTIEGQD